ncbi:MAG: hypothetical protein AAGH90_12020 [Pseudomonadota bacterium]
MSDKTYNHRDIMQTAWDRTRGAMRSGYTADQLRAVFADCLRAAWCRAKAAMRDAALTIEQVHMEIVDLQNRTRLNLAGQKRLSELQRLLCAKRDAADQAAKRSIIEDAGSQFVAVTFIKQDGSLRQMNIQPAALKSHVKGADASPAGQRAAATRKARHPHLMPVWDVEKAAIRSINLATVQSIKTGGQTHTFA